MYAAFLHLTFPPERHAEVSAFLVDEMGAVIRDNDGFVDFRVLDAGRPGELVIMDTWSQRDDSAAALRKPAAQAVHDRYTALGITVVQAARYELVGNVTGQGTTSPAS
jgi:quinol monooxygenase YgiN